MYASRENSFLELPTAKSTKKSTFNGFKLQAGPLYRNWPSVSCICLPKVGEGDAEGKGEVSVGEVSVDLDTDAPMESFSATDFSEMEALSATLEKRGRGHEKWGWNKR